MKPPPSKLTFLEIMIDVAGDFPSMRELAVRRKVEKAISKLGIGNCEGTGGGMGMMDLTFRVQDGPDAKAKAERLLAEQFPDLKSTLEVVEAEGDDESTEPGFIERHDISIPKLIWFVFECLVVLSLVVFGLWKLVGWLFFR